MKFTWGTGIFIFIMLFLAAMGTFVFFAFQQDVNLVSSGYYEKGVVFDDERAKSDRGTTKADFFAFESGTDYIDFKVDSAYFEQADSIKIQLYRPSDRHLDKLLVVDQPMVSIPNKDLQHGRYIIKWSWYVNNEMYYLEQTLMLK